MQQAHPDIRDHLLSAKLPAMPQVLVKLMEICQSDETGMSALAELIAKDPGMSTKALGIANSSAYHRASGRTANLEQSLAVLGTEMIKTLVINESVSQVFNHLNHAHGTDLRCFWKHSLSVAVIAKEIAARIGYASPEEAYLAGLLHDIGRLALLATTAKEYAHVFFAPDDDKLCAIESSLANLAHTEAGALLATRWNLDSFLADSLLYHHEAASRLASAHPLVRILMLAHLASQSQGDTAPLGEACEACGIATADVIRIAENSEAMVQKCADMLGIDLAGAEELTAPVDGWEIAGKIAALDDSNSGAADLPRNGSQDEARHRLAEEVRNSMLVTELRQSLSAQTRNGASRLDAVSRSARILFDLSDVAILEIDKTGEALIGIPLGEHRQRMASFTIPLGGSNRLAEAARQREVTFVEGPGEPLDLAEAQLMRLLGGQALVCLPLVARGHCYGVLLGATAANRLAGLKGRARFLATFGEHAAMHLQAPETTIATPAQPAATESRGTTRKIVHEANNALSIVKNYLGVLDGRLEKQQSADKEMAILHEEVDRVGRIIRRLSGSAESGGTSIAELNSLIHNVVQLFQAGAAAPARTQITARTPETPNEVECDPEALKQVLINLVKNAFEAMPENGEIVVSDNGLVNRDGKLYIEISVEDNGPGIPPDILASLFSPVQTSKGGHHQGLGLSIVHDLIKKDRGLISCRSGARGTCFEILLPIRQDSSAPPPEGVAK